MMRRINSRTYENVYTILHELNLFHELPKEKQELIETHKDTKYQYHFNKNMPIQFQIHDKETMIVLSYLYLKYINKEETIKKKLLDRYKKNEIEYQEEINQRYKIDNIFKSPKMEKNIQNSTTIDNSAMIPYKTTLFSKILNKIHNILHRKK